MTWQLGIAVNGVIALAYSAIAVATLRPLIRSRMLGVNRVGTATGLIFTSCAAGHAGHLLHLTGVLGVSGSVELQAARLAYDVHLVLIDAATAVIAVTFWSLRAREDDVTAPLFDETASARRHALVVNEEIVQGLVLATYQLETGDVDAAAGSLRETLEHARGIVAAPFQHDDLLPAGMLVSPSTGGDS